MTNKTIQALRDIANLAGNAELATCECGAYLKAADIAANDVEWCRELGIGYGCRKCMDEAMGYIELPAHARKMWS